MKISKLLVSVLLVAPITTWAASGTLPMTDQYLFDGSSWNLTFTGSTSSPVVPGSYNYGDSFLSPTTADPTYSAGFYDDYIFTIAGATANSVSSTIDLGGDLQISNMQARLFNFSGNPSPTLGIPSGGAIDGWSYPISTVGSYVVIPTTILAPGTYVLQIRGNVTGTSGGSYSGVLNLAAVPETNTWAMMIVGLGLVGLRLRRRMDGSHRISG